MLNSYSMSALACFCLFSVETLGFSRDTTLLTSVSSMYTKDQGGVPVAPLFYSVLGVELHFWSWFGAVSVGHVVWHMWQRGRRDGGRYMIVTPDSKNTTTVTLFRSRETRETAMNTHGGPSGVAARHPFILWQV